MSKKDVFISYKTEEFDEANWVKTTLETNGISCWMAPMCIPGGSSYALEIPQAIRECKVFVLILSERSQLSKWVPRELDQAINEGKTVLPFMLENCPLKDDFNFYLTNVQRYAAYESKTLAMERMIKEIRALIGVKENISAGQPVIKEEQPEQKQTAIKEEQPEKKKTEEGSAPTENPYIKVEQPVNNKQTPSEQPPRRRVPKWPFIVGAACLVSFILIVTSIGMSLAQNKNNQVAGVITLKKSDSWLSLEDVQLSIEDIETIRRFDNYTTMYFKNCTFPTTDLSGLFDNITYALQLENCGITDEHLANIEFDQMQVCLLNLAGNPGITQLDTLLPVSDTVTMLYLSDTGINDISDISRFTRLTELSIDGLGLTSLSALGDLTELTGLSVCRNQLTDLSGIEKNIRLKKIYASGNLLTGLTGLENTTLLDTLDVSFNQLTQLESFVAKNTGLKYVYLADNYLTDIDMLTDLKDLVEVDINGNCVLSLDPLSDKTEITYLWAKNNVISDISCLSQLTKIREIDLSENLLTSLDGFPINESGIRRNVYLSDNELTSVALPEDAYGLIELYLNPLTDVSALNNCTASSIVFDYDPDIDFSVIGNLGAYEVYIIDCPLDKQVSVSDTVGMYRTKFVTLQEYLAP